MYLSFPSTIFLHFLGLQARPQTDRQTRSNSYAHTTADNTVHFVHHFNCVVCLHAVAYKNGMKSKVEADLPSALAPRRLTDQPSRTRIYQSLFALCNHKLFHLHTAIIYFSSFIFSSNSIFSWSTEKYLSAFNGSKLSVGRCNQTVNDGVAHSKNPKSARIT